MNCMYVVLSNSQIVQFAFYIFSDSDTAHHFVMQSVRHLVAGFMGYFVCRLVYMNVVRNICAENSVGVIVIFS